MASNFKVNDDPFPVEPKGASISYMDLDGESERNANGKLVRQIIRRNVRKLEIEFGPITTAEALEILNMLNKPKFRFTFPSPRGDFETIEEAYCGDRQLGYLRTNYKGSIARGNSTGGSTNTQPSASPVAIDNTTNNTRSGGDNTNANALYDGLKVSIIEY